MNEHQEPHQRPTVTSKRVTETRWPNRWPFKAKTCSPLTWWRQLPPEAFGDSEHPLLVNTMQVDVTMTALVCAALNGNAAGALVVAQVIGVTDLGHELNIELAAAWLAHGRRHSAEPNKFRDAEVVLMAAFEEHRHKGDDA